MRKVSCCTISIICILLFCISSISAETLKIGVFDLQQVIRESKVVQGYRQTLIKEVEAKEKLFAEKEKSVKQIEEKLRKEGRRLSSAERRTLEERLSGEVRELRRLREDINVDLRKTDIELTQRALKDIEAIIKKIASEDNYTIIFERGAAGIVHLKDPVDITRKIITLYDKR